MKGKKCLEVVKLMEQLGRVSGQELTPEYYEQEQTLEQTVDVERRKR